MWFRSCGFGSLVDCFCFVFVVLGGVRLVGDSAVVGFSVVFGDVRSEGVFWRGDYFFGYVGF